MYKITFYKPSESYGEFSNFSDHPINIHGKVWPTIEHFFQAQKFHGTHFEEYIRKLPTPMEAKLSGQDKHKPLRTDWEKVKNDIMRAAVLAKFSQHSSLKKLLLSTEDKYLAEHTQNDRYWADGGDGRGRNMLGQILMEVRELLK